MLVSHEIGNAALRATERYWVNSHAEIMEIYQRVRDRGLEGLIVKEPGHKYHRKRDFGWLKMKAEESEDLIVTGFFEGQGKYVGKLGG